MVKEKRILSYFIGWLLIGFFIMFIGINKIFAATYDYSQFTAQLYDNYGPSLSAVTTNITNNRHEGIIPNMTANTSGGAWGITSPISLLANHTYTLTVTIDGTYGGNIVLSSYNRIGVGSILNNAISSYQENVNVDENLSKALNDGMTLQFAFTPSVNGSYIVFPFATSSTGGPWTFWISNIIIDDLGSKSLTQEEINSSLNNQTNILNNSINNSTNTITGAIGETENNINSNIDDMQDAIIDSNKELEETVKDQFNECRPSKNLLSNGFYQRYETTVYTTIDNLSAGTYTFSYDGPLASQLTVRQITNGVGTDISYIYNSNKITFHLSNSFSGEVEIYVYSGVNVNDIKNAMLNEGSTAISYEPYGEEVCSNRIDETNDKLDDLNSSLTDSSPTDMSGLGDSAGWLPPGPVDSILNLPLTFFLNLSESLSSECRPVELTLPFVNEKIYLPCIRTLYDKMGVTGTIFTTAGVIASAVILFNYLLALYKWVDDTLTLRENTMPGYYDDKWGGGA